MCCDVLCPLETTSQPKEHHSIVSSMKTTSPALQGKATVAQMFYNLFFCFWGNLCGSLLIVGLAFATGLFQSQPAGLKYSQNLSFMKATTEWGRVVARGFLCNW